MSIHAEEHAKGHTDEDQSRAEAISKARKINLQRPAIPNRTKVVRLFVVPKDLKCDDAERVRKFATERNATRADVFVVRENNGGLSPMSWLGDGLLAHQTAHGDHAETVVVLIGIDREQIEWQCDVRFRLTKIEKQETDVHSFTGTADTPDDPFMRDPVNSEGDPCRPIRSGPTKVLPGERPWDQLYKAHFSLEVDGKWLPLDPDFYCDWT
jgi:hypothetical protein